MGARHLEGSNILRSLCFLSLWLLGWKMLGTWLFSDGCDLGVNVNGGSQRLGWGDLTCGGRTCVGQRVR